MSDVESEGGMIEASSNSSSPPTSVRSSVEVEKQPTPVRTHALQPHRVGSFPSIRVDNIEAFFSQKNLGGAPLETSTPSPSTIVKSVDATAEALLRSLLSQTQNLLSKIGDVPSTIQTFQLMLTFMRSNLGPFSTELVMDILKFCKPLTRALQSQPLVAVTLLEQANLLAERFGIVEYQIKFSLQMPLILLPEMDLQSDDTMKQLRRAVQECAGAHLLITKYLSRLQSASNAAVSPSFTTQTNVLNNATSHNITTSLSPTGGSNLGASSNSLSGPSTSPSVAISPRTDAQLTSKIEKLSTKLNALLSTLEKMFLLYTAEFVSFHPHILQTLDAEAIFHHYNGLEKLANQFLRRGDYERARALFPTKVSIHLMQHNPIYGLSLLKINSDINQLECRLHGIILSSSSNASEHGASPFPTPRKIDGSTGTGGSSSGQRTDSNVLLDILNELEQDQLERLAREDSNAKSQQAAPSESASSTLATQAAGSMTQNGTYASSPYATQFDRSHSPSLSAKSRMIVAALRTDSEWGFEEANFMQYRKAFSAIRKQVPSILLVSDDQGNLDTNLVNRVQLKLTRGVREIISTIINHALDLAGPPPCHFCIMGLGSHGRIEVAPYSDFEFALLLEKDIHNDDGSNEDSFISSYFGRFVEMMDFLVNCIGEPTGFRLDTQGTPKEYRFRGTPQQIVDRAFKNLDAQGIPMAFSLLQPTCIYVGGPPKPVFSEKPATQMSQTSTYANLAASTPVVSRAQTSLSLTHSAVTISSPSSSAHGNISTTPSATPSTPEVRKVSSTTSLQPKRPVSGSRAPPPAMIPMNDTSFATTSSVIPQTALPQISTPTAALSPLTPHAASTTTTLNSLVDSSEEEPIRRPSSSGSGQNALEQDPLFSQYRDLVITRLQHDIWKGQHLHASLARYCLQDHIKMLATGRKWHRPLDKPDEVHLKDHFLTPLICFTHDIALYYLSHVPTVFPSDASATAHLMDSLAIPCARLPVPIFASAFASSFREAWAALNAIRIRAELEYGEQIDAETPVFLDSKSAPPHGVVLTPIERYWLKFVEWVVQKPLYRVLPAFLEAMPSTTSKADAQSKARTPSASRPRSHRRSSLGTNPLTQSADGRPALISPGGGSSTSVASSTGNAGSSMENRGSSSSDIGANNAEIIAPAAIPSTVPLPPFHLTSSSQPTLSSSLQATSPLASSLSVSNSASAIGTPSSFGGRTRSGSDAQLTGSTTSPQQPASLPESEIELMDPAIYCVEQLLEQVRNGARVKDIADWVEPIISLAWTLTLRHSSPRVHLSYYRSFPHEWRSTYYQTLEQLELVHAPLLEHVFHEIRSYADPAGSRLHSKPMDSLWREQVTSEITSKLESALVSSVEHLPDIPLPTISPTGRSPGKKAVEPSPKVSSSLPHASPISSPTHTPVTTTPLTPTITHQWLPSKLVTTTSPSFVTTLAVESPDLSPISTPPIISSFGTPLSTLSIPETIAQWNTRKLDAIQPRRLEGRVVETESMIFFFPSNLLSSIAEICANQLYRRVVFKGSAQMSIARLSLRRYLRELLERPGHVLSSAGEDSEDTNTARKSVRKVDKSDSTSSMGSAPTASSMPSTAASSNPSPRSAEHRKQSSSSSAPNSSVNNVEKKKTITACLVIQKNSGPTLGSLLEDNPENLSILDRQSFADTFLASLLFIGVDRLPEDFTFHRFDRIDKDNHIMEAARLVVSRHKNPWAESGMMDLEHANDGSRQMTIVRNILFCLDQMREPMDPDSLFQFLDLDPISVITGWLKELKQTQQRWASKFAASEVRKIFQPTPLQVGAQQTDLVSIPDWVVPKMASLITKIQTILRANHRATYLELLKMVHPVVGHVYAKAHQNVFNRTPLERFEEASRPFRVATIYRLLPRSSDVQQFLPRSFTNSLSVAEARLQLQNHIKESAMLADTKVLIMESFNQSRWELFHFNPQLQQRVLDALDSKDLPVPVQSSMIALIEQSNQRLSEITIRNSDVLDNALLDSLVRQSGSFITKLHLPGCQKLENRFIGGTDVVKLLADHCAGLVSLDLSGTNIKYFAVQQLTRTAEIKFERLEWLILDHCRQLEKVKLNTPALWHVDARYCPELVKFEAQTKGVCTATADLFSSKIVCAKLLMLRGLTLSKPLSYLSVNARKLGDLIEPLEGLLSDPSKTRFEVSHRTLPPDFITILAAVTNLSSLSDITINSCEVEDESIRALANACFASRKCNVLSVPTLHSSNSSTGSSSTQGGNRPDTPSEMGQSCKLKLAVSHCRVAPAVQADILGRALGTNVSIQFTE